MTMPSEFGDDYSMTTSHGGSLADAISASLKLPWPLVMQAVRAGCKTEEEVRMYLRQIGAIK